MTLLRPFDHFLALYMIMVRAADDHSIPADQSDTGTTIVINIESSQYIATCDKQVFLAHP